MGVAGLLQGLDPLADLRGGGRVELELQELLVCADRHRGLTKRVGRLSQAEQRLFVMRLNLDDQLVGRDRSCCGRLVLHGGRLQRRVRLAGQGRRDRVLAQRLPELVRGGGQERGAHAGVLLRESRELSFAEVAVGLPELELAQVPKGHDVLGLHGRVLPPGSDRLVDATLLLQRSCELLAGRGVERALVDPLLRLRDRRAGAAVVAERVADELAEVEPSGTDAEEDETACEDNDEEARTPTSPDCAGAGRTSCSRLRAGSCHRPCGRLGEHGAPRAVRGGGQLLPIHSSLLVARFPVHIRRDDAVGRPAEHESPGGVLPG